MEVMLKITDSEEWRALKHSPVLLPYLRATVASHQDNWAQWEYEADDPTQAMKNNAKALGIVGWLLKFIDQLENIGQPQEQPQENKAYVE